MNRSRLSIPLRRGTEALIALTLLGAGALAPVQAQATPTGDVGPSTVAAIDRYIEQRLATSPVPGVALAVTKGDRVLQVRGFGHDSASRPVTGRTLFRIASASKSFTALAVMQLVEAGSLSLDDAVASRLPEFRMADPRGAAITVRQLLDQTSGLADRSAPDLRREQPRTLAQATRALQTARLVAPPGTEWNYSNANYQLAGRLVEVVSGDAFPDYLQRHVFRPAGMSASTTTNREDDPVPGLVDGHVEAYGGAIPTRGPGDFVAGAGGVVTSAADMARWLIINANGGLAPDGARIISKEGMRQLHTASAPNGYAFGWATRGPRADPTRIGHSGSVLTFSSEQVILPRSGVGVALLFNSSSALMFEQRAILDGVLRILDGGTPSDSPIPPWAVDGLLAVLTVAVLGGGATGAARGRRWAERHRRAPLRIVARLLPLLGVICAVAAFPTIGVWLMGGRDVTWRAAAYGWPALVALVVATALAALATLASRAIHLLADGGIRRSGGPKARGRNRQHRVLGGRARRS